MESLAGSVHPNFDLSVSGQCGSLSVSVSVSGTGYALNSATEGGAGRGPGGTQKRFIRGGSDPRSNPLPF